ncbi:MAG: 50S ribosomal protein L25 [Candidatus Gottesmanbacteria bacterium]|nr:50S ribosomal protein L25 [Candidatus Gottesmanbacteria bacterium]
MKKHSLSATKRDSLGRKVKKLRKAGELPATVYGKKVKSVSLTVASEAFAKTYGEAGETGLIELSVGGAVRHVLIHHVQKHPVTGTILHVEFHQVDLKEKVHAKVPIVLTGQSSVVSEKRGVVLSILDGVEVEALPTELVEHIEVDVTALSEVGQEVKVKDLKVPAGLTVLTDAELTIVKVGSLITKEAASEVAADVAKAAEAASEVAAEGAAAAPTAEGAAPAEKAKEESAKKE